MARADAAVGGEIADANAPLRAFDVTQCPRDDVGTCALARRSSRNCWRASMRCSGVRERWSSSASA